MKKPFIASAVILLIITFYVLRRTPRPTISDEGGKTSFTEVIHDNETIVSIKVSENEFLHVDLETFSELEQDEKVPSFEPLRQYCLDRYPEFTQLPNEGRLRELLLHPERRVLWTNVHLEAEDGTIYRVRTFVDDGPNTSVQRLALYKEDDHGFPELITLPEEQRTNPSEETLKAYLTLGEVIHREDAVGLEAQGQDFFFEIHNDQLIRLDITSPEGHLNCLFESDQHY